MMKGFKVRLTPESIARLHNAAELDKRPLSEFIRLALDARLDEFEKGAPAGRVIGPRPEKPRHVTRKKRSKKHKR